MDNEKYGIELELITGKFNKQVDKVKKQVNSIGKVKKLEDYNDLRKAPTSAWKQWANEGQVKRLQEYSDLSKAPVSAWKQWAEESKKVSQNIKDTTKDTKDLNNQASRLKITFNTNPIQKNIDKMTSKIKRFGLSLLGIRSIWSLLSRASSAYLSQNTELANKLQSVWVSLGAILAPVIEFIVALFIKAIGYINGFIKALTGVDLLAKNTAKSVNKTTGAVKSLNKALAGFDELQNLDTDTGGGTGGGLGGLEDFEDLSNWADDQLKDVGKKVRKWFLGSDKTDLQGILADNWEIMKKHWNTMIVPLAKFLKQTMVDPVFDGFKKIFKKMAPYLEPLKNELEKMMEVVRPKWEAQWKMFVDFVKPNVVDPIVEYFKPIGIKIYNFLVPYINKIIDKMNDILGNFGIKINRLETIAIDGIENTTEKFNKAAAETTLNSNMMVRVLTGDLSKIKKGQDEVSNNTIKFKTDTTALVAVNTGVSSILDSLQKVTGKKWTINATIEAIAGRTVNTALQGLRTAFSAVGITLPYLDVGTNYVPQDQLAMIHKGEAVIPKKFNSQEYFGGSDETNSKLDALIDAVNNIEINPYTTIRDVGKASLSYINNKSRQLGESVVV